jgi:hypothetical protein
MQECKGSGRQIMGQTGEANMQRQEAGIFRQSACRKGQTGGTEVVVGR